MRTRLDATRAVIGNPSNRRVQLYQSALQRLNLAPARVISYRELLQGMVSEPGRAAAWLRESLADSQLLRIESPGEDFEVEKGLIAIGAEAEPCARLTPQEAANLVFEKGRLRFVREWYQGYRKVLAIVAEAAASLPRYNDPDDIALMFDKTACQEFLQRNGVPTPTRLPKLKDFDQLFEQVLASGWNRVFLKLSHGSSASGVAAIHFHSHGVRALSTVEMETVEGELRLFNSLRLQAYHDTSVVRMLVDRLLAEGAHAEKWLPKAAHQGRNFDLRVLTVSGQPSHVVVRTSESPLTNLHLGNRRGDLALLQSRVGPERWSEIMQVARQVAEAFPRSLHIGVDIMVQPGFREPRVLEANAFGDLLPGVLKDGCDSYEWEIRHELVQSVGR